MKRTNMVLPSPSMPNDTAPQGRYKSVILNPRLGTRTSSNSKLSPGYLRTFGFDNSGSSSPLESSKPTEHSNPQPAVSGDETAEVWSPDCDSLPPPPTTPPPPLPPPSADDMREEHFLVLSESHLNVLSHNLSEIADRISPSTYDPMIEIDEESLEVVIDENIGHSSETVVSNSEQPTRFKTPYSRQRRDSKTYVSKQKSFTRKRSSAGRNDSHREMNNNGEISVDASNVLNFSAGNVEGFRQDSESDSGYSSSMSTSISLSEEIEAVKRHSSSTDVDADDLTFSGDDNVRKGSADNPVMSEFTGNSTLNQNTGNIKKRLDSLINGASSGIGSLNLSREVESSNTGIYSQTATVSNDLGKQSASFKLPVTNKENIPTVHKEAKELAESQSNLQKQTLDDTALPRTKTGRRPGLQRRRTTAMSFRPPKQITVHEGESDTVEMDEAGFVQMLTDFKSLKTQLLKLKRELQEADVVSPLMHPHSSVTRSGSFSMEYTDPTDRTPLHRKQKMLLHRTMTMDSATMKEKLCRTSSASSTGGGLGNLNDIAETIEAGSVPEHWLESNTADEKEINNLHKELEDVKERLSEITEERNSLMIAREELEHELDSKNHTIRMLQKQLESQTDSQDEMAYLKRQVKLLTNQIQQQQQKITELRYRESSPGPVQMGAISTSFQQKKEAVKADIRNRLRDAFVKHLGESSKSNVQLSKYIQKAEQNISMAQKGLSSLYSSPHASTEHLPKDKSRPSLERSDSQSSVERSQEDSDGREYESDSSRCSRRCVEGSRANRNNEDSGSESGKSTRRRGESLSTVKSQDESDGIASDSDSGKSRRRRTESLPFECNTEEIKRKDSKTGEQIEASDAHNRSKPDSATPLPYVRKLSRSKLLNKIEASPLSHSWTPSAIEKIVKSWRETKSPASQEKKKEEEKTLKPVSHVQFL